MENLVGRKMREQLISLGQQQDEEGIEHHILHLAQTRTTYLPCIAMSFSLTLNFSQRKDAIRNTLCLFKLIGKFKFALTNLFAVLATNVAVV